MMTLEEHGNMTVHRLLSGSVAVSLTNEDEKGIPLVCFHESGHAVAGLHYGYIPLRITVRADGSGLTEFEPTPGLENLPPMDRPDIERLAIVQQIVEHGGESLDLDKAETETAKLLLREWVSVSTIAQRLGELLHGRAEAVLEGAEAVSIWKYLKGGSDGLV